MITTTPPPPAAAAAAAAATATATGESATSMHSAAPSLSLGRLRGVRSLSFSLATVAASAISLAFFKAWHPHPCVPGWTSHPRHWPFVPTAPLHPATVHSTVNLLAHTPHFGTIQDLVF